MTDKTGETLPASTTEMITASHASDLPPLDDVIQTAQKAAIDTWAVHGIDTKNPQSKKRSKTWQIWVSSQRTQKN